MMEKGVVSLVGAGGKTSLMFRLAGELAAAGQSVLTTTTTKILPPTPQQSRHLIVSDSLPEVLDRAAQILAHSSHVCAAAGFLASAGKLTGYKPSAVRRFWESHLFDWIIVEADGAAGRPLKAPAPHEPVIAACSHQVIGVVGLSALGRRLDEDSVFRSTLFAKRTGVVQGGTISMEALLRILTHPQGLFKGTPSGAKKTVLLNQADIPGKKVEGFAVFKRLAEHNPSGICRVGLGSVSLDPAGLTFKDL